MTLRTIFLTIISILFSFTAFAQGPKITYKTTPGKMRIKEVDKGSIYAAAGFKSGDVVKEIDGKVADQNSTATQLDTAIRAGKVIKIERNGKVLTLKPKPMDSEIETQENAYPGEDPN